MYIEEYMLLFKGKGDLALTVDTCMLYHMHQQKSLHDLLHKK